jgi:glycosyltransferase involved in cell wall biosynthesis
MYIADHGATGFGTVSKGLLTHLHATGRWDILQLGINFNDLVPTETPWKLVPAGFYSPDSTGVYNAIDPFGYTKAQTYVNSFDPDLVFFNNDFPVVIRYIADLQDKKLTPLGEHPSKKVIYSPLDSQPCPPAFLDIAANFDEAIAYSYWQREQMARMAPTFEKMPVMYHGYDPKAYYPINKRQAKKELGRVFRKYNRGAFVPDFRNKFLVYFVGTNQWRKDLPVLFKAYTEFRKMHPDAEMFLIPHTSATPMSPTHGGWSLYNLRDLLGLSDAVLMQNANIFTDEEMNIFYNAADVLAFPTRGEGFGLPSLEAMMTKTPVIATKFGPQEEIHEGGRGYFIEVQDYEPGPMSALTLFAKPSWRSLAEQLNYVYTHPDEVAETVERAYQWAKPHTWESKAQQLERILEECLHRSSTRSTSKPSAVLTLPSSSSA